MRISDPLRRRLCKSGEGGRDVVQHVRVTPARLLNFASHKVTVYSWAVRIQGKGNLRNDAEKAQLTLLFALVYKHLHLSAHL